MKCVPCKQDSSISIFRSISVPSNASMHRAGCNVVMIWVKVKILEGIRAGEEKVGKGQYQILKDSPHLLSNIYNSTDDVGVHSIHVVV